MGGDHRDIGQATSVSHQARDVGGGVRQGDRSIGRTTILRLFEAESVCKRLWYRTIRWNKGVVESERGVVSEVPDMLTDNETEAGCGA